MILTNQTRYIFGEHLRKTCFRALFVRQKHFQTKTDGRADALTGEQSDRQAFSLITQTKQKIILYAES